MFESFAPMRALAGHLPSLPPHPISVQREVGTPRPATHNMEYGGMQVAVGNVKLNDGVWDVLFSLVVNNMVRGAYGAALLMAEYYDHLKSHPAALAAATSAHAATNGTGLSPRGGPSTHRSWCVCPASYLLRQRPGPKAQLASTKLALLQLESSPQTTPGDELCPLLSTTRPNDKRLSDESASDPEEEVVGVEVPARFSHNVAPAL